MQEKLLKNEIELPPDLAQGLNSLAWNGDPLGLLSLNKKNDNKEKILFQLSKNQQQNVYSVVHNSLNRIEIDMDYKTALFNLQLLVDCGLSSKENLIACIDKYCRENMLENISKKYSQEFISEFKDDLIEKINF